MARPKREPGVPEARERILDAFWELLEDNECDKITVSMVCEKACCYRRTFYYHYDNMDDLVEKAIKDVLFGNAGIQRITMSLAVGAEFPEEGIDAATGRSARRVALIARHGELGKVKSEITRDVTNVWRSMLCVGGEKLEPDVEVIIDAMTGLGLSLFVEASMRQEGFGAAEAPLFSPAVFSFMEDTARCALNRVCEAQGVSEADVRARIKANTMRDGSMSQAEQSGDPEQGCRS